MFNTLTLAALLAATIGYRPSYEGAPDEPTLPDTLKAADGTVAVQDVHPLLTLANIRLAAPQMTAAGFLEFLANVRTTAATKVLTTLREQKQLAGTGKRLLDSRSLTERSGQYRDKIIRQGRFVGLALRPRADKPDISVRITAVGTQFTQPEPGFKLVLLHSSDMSAPVKEYPLPRLDRVYFEWSPLDIDLSQKAGGTWYLGYYEDDVVSQALKLDQNLQQRPGQCCGNDYLNYDAWNPYMQVLPFSRAAPDADITYQNDTNWGLNLRVEASCNLTTRLAGQLDSFTSALRLQLATDLLTMMANSTRHNGTEAVTKAMALMELNNRPDHQVGFLSQLSTAYKALDVDLSAVASVCLPCAPKAGTVKFKPAI